MAESTGEARRTTLLYMGSVKFSVFFVSTSAARLSWRGQLLLQLREVAAERRGLSQL